MLVSREILLAEDNPADVRLIEEALRGLHPPAKIHVARDGDETLHFFQRCRDRADSIKPALMFLDYHLPKTDLRDILRAMKSNEAMSRTAVVVLTTSNVDELIDEAYRLGADCYLSKPSDLDAFFHTIQSAARYWLNFPSVQ